jgi:hypothetical protein
MPVRPGGEISGMSRFRHEPHCALSLLAPKSPSHLLDKRRGFGGLDTLRKDHSVRKSLPQKQDGSSDLDPTVGMPQGKLGTIRGREQRRSHDCIRDLHEAHARNTTARRQGCGRRASGRSILGWASVPE